MLSADKRLGEGRIRNLESKSPRIAVSPNPRMNDQARNSNDQTKTQTKRLCLIILHSDFVIDSGIRILAFGFSNR